MKVVSLKVKESIALAWIAFIVLAYYVLNYLFVPKYVSALTEFLSKILG